MSVDKDEENLVQQQFKDQCDINNIMAKFQKTGVVDHVKQYGSKYGEVNGQTFLEAMYLVTNAQTMFNDLPSKARTFFENDPAKFLDYVEGMPDDGQERENKLIELGLAHGDIVEVSSENAPPGATEEPSDSTEGDQPIDST